MYYKSETFPGKREWNVNLIGELEKICKCVHSATNISAEIFVRFWNLGIKTCNTALIEDVISTFSGETGFYYRAIQERGHSSNKIALGRKLYANNILADVRLVTIHLSRLVV